MKTDLNWLEFLVWMSVSRKQVGGWLLGMQNKENIDLAPGPIQEFA